MSYVEGFLLAVPEANRDAYVEHARTMAPMLKGFGVARMVEGWGVDVPHGTRTDMWRAVNATDGEQVLFSWFEYPDKAVRDAAVARMMDDPQMAEAARDMPFDGKRMIWGGFAVVSDAGSGRGRFIDGVVIPVAKDGIDAFTAHARAMAPVFLAHGAVRVVDALADDVQPGEVTDFARAVQLADEEAVAFGWVEWPDKATRDAAWDAIMADPAMAENPPPFDGRRMIFGGYEVVVDA